MQMKFVLAAAVIAMSGGAAQASSFSDPYTSFWALGDSLTDNGNLFAIANQPGAPYFAGRFSNGPTYAEYLAADFTAQGKPNGNLAYGGALAVTNADPIPDLALQAFGTAPIYADGSTGLAGRAAQFGARPLVSLFAGSNDILGALGSFKNPFKAAAEAAKQMLTTIVGLNSLGVSDFIVLGLPDFGAIPRLNGLPALIPAVATASAQTFNALVSGGIDLLPADVNVTKVDVFSALRDVLADPDPLGLTNTTDACLTFGKDGNGNPTISGLCADPARYAFFDDIHPSGTVHAALASTVRAEMVGNAQAEVAIVPLPAAGWALLAALAGLAAVSRHRAS